MATNFRTVQLRAAALASGAPFANGVQLNALGSNHEGLGRGRHWRVQAFGLTLQGAITQQGGDPAVTALEAAGAPWASAALNSERFEIDPRLTGLDLVGLLALMRTGAAVSATPLAGGAVANQDFFSALLFPCAFPELGHFGVPPEALSSRVWLPQLAAVAAWAGVGASFDGGSLDATAFAVLKAVDGDEPGDIPPVVLASQNNDDEIVPVTPPGTVPVVAALTSETGFPTGVKRPQDDFQTEGPALLLSQLAYQGADAATLQFLGTFFGVPLVPYGIPGDDFGSEFPETYANGYQLQQVGPQGDARQPAIYLRRSVTELPAGWTMRYDGIGQAMQAAGQRAIRGRVTTSFNRP